MSSTNLNSKKRQQQKKMQNKIIKFGTDGWRAVIARDFTFDNVKIVSQAVADYLRKAGKKKKRLKVAIGYDRRFLDRLQYFIGDFHDDGICISIGHQAGNGAFTCHTEFSGIIQDDKIDIADFTEFGRNSGTVATMMMGRPSTTVFFQLSNIPFLPNAIICKSIYMPNCIQFMGSHSLITDINLLEITNNFRVVCVEVRW